VDTRGIPNKGRAVVKSCSQQVARDRQGTGTTFQTFRDVHPYKQLCVQYTVIDNLNSGNVVGSGSIIDSLSSSRVEGSSNPNLIGTNPNNSTDFRTLASDTASEAARAINSALGLNTGNGEGMSANDLKFFAYATFGLIGIIALSKIIKEIKKA